MTRNRTHTVIDRAVIAGNAMRAIGYEATVARLMRAVPGLAAKQACAALLKMAGQ